MAKSHEKSQIKNWKEWGSGLMIFMLRKAYQGDAIRVRDMNILPGTPCQIKIKTCFTNPNTEGHGQLPLLPLRSPTCSAQRHLPPPTPLPQLPGNFRLSFQQISLSKAGVLPRSPGVAILESTT